MINLIKTALLLSVQHVAREAAKSIDETMRKEDKDDKKYKRKMLMIGIVHTLLGTIYND